MQDRQDTSGSGLDTSRLDAVLAGTSDLLPAAAAVLDAVLRIEGIDCGGVYAVDRESGDLELLVTRGLSEAFVSRVRRFPAGSRQAALVTRGEPMYRIYGELAERELDRDPDDPNRAEGLRAIAVVPILHAGKVIGCINGSSHSTSEIPEASRRALASVAARIGMAVARIRAEEDLRASEEQFRAMFRNAVDGILLADVATKRFLDGNRAICTMLGYSSDEIRGLSVADIHPPDSLPLVLSHFERQASRGDPVAPELPVLRKDGSVFHADINSSVVTLRGRRVLMGIFRDASERHRAQSEMVRAERLEAIGLLAGGIAHDFNNILTGISGSISLARHLAAGDEALAELLAAAEDAAMRASDLTRQLLTFAEGGSPVRRAASVSELIRESARFVLLGSRARLRFSPPADLWPVDVDPGQIGQVIQNLVLNASQAMPEGGVVEVTAGNEERAGPGGPERFVRIAVTDTGGGIPPENLGRVFDPYFTTKEAGSGLGLAICHSIVTRHGGRIEVESRPGRGSTFRVELPVAVDGPGEEAALRPPADPCRGGTVLLMDDDPVVRRVSSRMLEVLGCRVTAVADGDAALARAGEALAAGAPFDFAVLDLTVAGGMGGVECAAGLHRLDPRIRLVVSSGYSDDPAMADPGSFGFCSVIAKPYRLEDLREVLRRCGALPAGPASG